MSTRLSWAVRLERAEKRGRFTETDGKYAIDWSSCAIGERHDWEKNFKPSKQDFTRRESDLGLAFESAVHHQDIPRAQRLYAEIMALP